MSWEHKIVDIIFHPRLLLLDEPTASLDTASVLRVIEIVQSIKETGTGILAVKNSQELVNKLADVVITLFPTA